MREEDDRHERGDVLAARKNRESSDASRKWIHTECQAEGGISHLEITSQCATSIYSFATGKLHRLHYAALLVRHPPAQNGGYSLGVVTIDHIDENIPNINWEAIRNTSAPVSGLLIFDTAYTLRVGGLMRNVRSESEKFLLHRHE